MSGKAARERRRLRRGEEREARERLAPETEPETEPETAPETPDKIRRRRYWDEALAPPARTTYCGYGGYDGEHE